MGTDTGASDIGSPDRAHRGLPAFGYGADEFVDQVRVGTAVSGALDEGDVIGIYNLFPLCKALDGFWKTCQYIRDLILRACSPPSNRQMPSSSICAHSQASLSP